MQEIKLIEAENFLPYRSIAANIDAARRVDPYTIEAQSSDLAPLMGASLYFDLLKYTQSLAAGRADAAGVNPPITYTPTAEEAKFETLLKGGSYVIYAGTEKELTKMFSGITKVLVYFTYSRFVLRDNIRNTPTGFAKKVTLESQPISRQEANEESVRAIAVANIAFQNVDEFLRDSQHVAGHENDWKKYVNCGGDCCGGNRRVKKTISSVRNPARKSKNWNRNER